MFSVVAEIKCQCTRTAKQLSAKNLLELINSDKLADDFSRLLKTFALAVNAFRRPEVRYDNLIEEEEWKLFLKQNARSILPELLSMGSKAMKFNFCGDQIEQANLVFATITKKVIKHCREAKIIFEFLTCLLKNITIC